MRISLVIRNSTPNLAPRSSVSNLGSTGWSYAAIPLIFVFMLLIRGACLAGFNPLFRLVGEREWLSPRISLFKS